MSNSHDIDLNELPEHIHQHIDKLQRMRRDFVANVSHELRTPLTVFKGYIETLLLQPTIDATTLNDIYLQMQRHSNRMEDIINDLLLLAHLEYQDDAPLISTDINLHDMIHNTIDDLQHMCDEKRHNVTIYADKQLTLSGNPDELKSLISNLLINAIKYTQPDGHIQIEWHTGNSVKVLRITDNGPGIDPVHIPRLTERFYRADKARSREEGGTGLGLAIVKHVLLRHHGELNIDSTLGKGSVFSCVFQ